MNKNEALSFLPLWARFLPVFLVSIPTLDMYLSSCRLVIASRKVALHNGYRPSAVEALVGFLDSLGLLERLPALSTRIVSANESNFFPQL